jgi:hypothetical protein
MINIGGFSRISAAISPELRAIARASYIGELTGRGWG